MIYSVGTADELIAYLLCRITNAVKESGGLKEKLFHTAYNAKRHAIIKGKNIMNSYLVVRPLLLIFYLISLKAVFP